MIPKNIIDSCEECTLKKQYYNNKKIKSIYNCKYFKQRLYFCKECGSVRMVWDKLDILCLSCGLVHAQIDEPSDSDEREDINVHFG